MCTLCSSHLFYCCCRRRRQRCLSMGTCWKYARPYLQQIHNYSLCAKRSFYEHHANELLPQMKRFICVGYFMSFIFGVCRIENIAFSARVCHIGLWPTKSIHVNRTKQQEKLFMYRWERERAIFCYFFPPALRHNEKKKNGSFARDEWLLWSKNCILV